MSSRDGVVARARGAGSRVWRVHVAGVRGSVDLLLLAREREHGLGGVVEEAPWEEQLLSLRQVGCCSLCR